MARHRNSSRPTGRSALARGLVIGVIVLLVIGAVALTRKPKAPPMSAAVSPATNSSSVDTNLPFILVNQALMVTVELDFGGPVPSVAEALRQIERRHQPDDGRGRVFAILDGYGEPTADGKKLHLSMHVSTEKPGIGSIVFKRTGEALWSGRIISTNDAAPAFSGSQLTVLIDVGDGRLLTVDGSGNPASILETKVKELGQPMAEFWKDGAEHEMTFIYSACGCPVKVMCRRVGDRTERTKEMPVIFPDDPAVVEVIKRLMRW
jgi:hypothetical protein